MALLISPEYFQEQMATLGLKSSFAPSAYSVDTLIAEASEWVEGYTDRKFELQTVTEVIRGPVRNTERLVLDNYPVASITTVAWVDDDAQTGTETVAGMRILSGGVIEFKNNHRDAFYRSRTYTVEYETGYAVIPRMVQRATALKIAQLIQPQYQGAQEREIFMISNIDAMIVDALEPFRRERYG